MTIVLIVAIAATAFMAGISVTKRAVRVWRTIAHLLTVVLAVLLILTGHWKIVVVVVILAAATFGFEIATRYIRAKRQESDAE